MIRTDELQKPFGQSLGWTDEQLEALAQVTELDVVAAREHWIQYAPRRYKSLLDAVEVEP